MGLETRPRAIFATISSSLPTKCFRNKCYYCAPLRSVFPNELFQDLKSNLSYFTQVLVFKIGKIMRREEEVPFLYQEPSAPPLPFGSSRSNRVVQPFEIAAEAASEMYSVAETVPAAGSHQQTRGPSVILTAGRIETRQLEAKINSGNPDGFKIANYDGEVIRESNYRGTSEHLELNRKINLSQSDYVHELGATLPLPSAAPVTYATVCESNSAVEEKLRALEKKAEPSGYQFADYTSTYEVGGGYKYEDYKSIYDK